MGHEDIKRVLVYARESVEEGSSRGLSVPRQVQYCSDWAQREGWEVVRVVRENRSGSVYGRGGGAAARTQWPLVLAAIEAGEIDALLTWENSRAGRDLAVYVELREACQRYGVLWGYAGKLHDLRDPGDQTLTALQAVLSENESARISQRVTDALAANAKAGRPHGRLLFGYQRIYEDLPNGKRRIRETIEHPDQAPVVREIVARVLAGDTCYVIARDLNARGVPSRRLSFRENRRQLGWTMPAVKEVATNPGYAGIRIRRPVETPGVEERYEADWPKLVSPEDRAAVLAILEAPERKRKRDWSARHLLSGIATCADCGALLRVGKQNAGPRRDRLTGEKLPKPEGGWPFYHTYLCSGAPGRSSFHVAIKCEHLDALVTEAVLAQLAHPEFLAELSVRGGDTDAERQAVVAELASYERHLAEAKRLAAAELDMTILLDQRELLAPKVEAAEARLRALTKASPEVVALAGYDDVAAAWDRLDLPSRRRVLRELVVPVVARSQRPRGSKGLEPGRLQLIWR